jgi:HEAT repeat protein
VRALRPHIGSRLPLPDGTFLGVTAARVDGPTRAPAGGLVRAEGDRLLLDCHGGALELTEIRPPGSRVMAAADWLRGRPDPALTCFRLDPALPDRPLEELLASAREEWADGEDEWQPHVSALAARASREVLDAMVALTADADPLNRELAAFVIGQLGWGERPFAAEQEAALAALAEREEDPEVLAAVACAFGHLGERAGQAWLLAQREHADADVRESVAFALAGRNGNEVLEALIELSADAAPGVRDWATFALGTLADVDTPELRDALVARLADSDDDTRLEAVHGLALRGDHRADDAARELLAQRDHEDIWTRHLLDETADALDLGP